MKIGGQIPWNAFPICETFKICCLMGGQHMKGDSANHSKDQQFRLARWSNHYHISAKDLSRLHQLGKKVLPIMFLGFVLHAG